jgi:hypothetical protein
MQTYDAFAGPALDAELWVPGAVRLGDDVIWTYADPGLVTTVRDGVCELAIERFSLRHHGIQMFDNPKALYFSKRNWLVAGQPLSFGCRLAAQFSGNDSDYRNGFASFNALDFATGTVMDIVGNGRKLWAITERLDIPGLESPIAPFSEVVDLQVATEPLREHAVEVRYDPGAHEVRYIVDGVERYRRAIETAPRSIMLGLGLITLYPIADGVSTSCRGQGGRGRFSAVLAPD